MQTFYLDVELMEKMCHPLAVAVFDTNEDPIPPFSPHAKGLLESALHSPKQTFDGKELYPTLIDKVTILYYGLVQNHPFPNGNKRIAMASLLIFLYINNHWLEADNKELANWTIKIASSGETKSNLDLLLNELRGWLQDRTRELTENEKRD